MTEFLSTKPAVKAEDLPYRPCVGIMVLNKEGLVWSGRRIAEGNSEYDGSPQLWQMPQGGIDPGEDALPAAMRELYEETGITSVCSAHPLVLEAACREALRAGTDARPTSSAAGGGLCQRTPKNRNRKSPRWTAIARPMDCHLPGASRRGGATRSLISGSSHSG